MQSDAEKRKDTAFIGHPVGLGWLSFSEFWERFSYYGMQSLIALYTVHYLLLPGHIEHVIGFGALKRFVELFYGQGLSPLALGVGITGLYSGLVYLTPILGGALADRVIGRTPTVALGASLMAAGEFLLAADAGFAIGLLLLLIGVGCFKGNIASQVGDLYSQDDPRRADGFQIYFLGIQIAVIVAPTLCGWLSQDVEWHLGFVAAGVAMVFGLITYLAGRKTFPPEPIRHEGSRIERPPLTDRDWKVVAILVLMLPVLALSVIGNQEIFVAYPLWAEKSYQLTYFGHTVPVTSMLSFDAIVSTFLMAAVIAFWRWWARHWREPEELTKMIIGTAISATGPLVLAAAAARVAATGQPVSLAWAFGFHFLNDLGFANVLPVGLALYSRAAPKGLGGFMIAVYYTHLFLIGMTIGKIGGLMDKMSGVNFWLLHSALMAVAVGLLIAVQVFFGRVLAPTYGEPKEAAA
jgi:POT family proton-dependent oligopeptide transporter